MMACVVAVIDDAPTLRASAGSQEGEVRPQVPTPCCSMDPAASSSSSPAMSPSRRCRLCCVHLTGAPDSWSNQGPEIVLAHEISASSRPAEPRASR